MRSQSDSIRGVSGVVNSRIITVMALMSGCAGQPNDDDQEMVVLRT